MDHVVQYTCEAPIGDEPCCMHAVSSMAAFGLLEVRRTQGTHCSHTHIAGGLSGRHWSTRKNHDDDLRSGE